MRKNLIAMALAGAIAMPAAADWCNRSGWIDAALFTSAGIEFMVGHFLGQKRASTRVAVVATRAAKYARWARVATGIGAATLVAEGALNYYDAHFCSAS